MDGNPLSLYSGCKRKTKLLPSLNSGEIMSSIFCVVTAMDKSVGGTVKFSNVPLMESLPPIAATSSSFCAKNAPSIADNGFPHFSASCPNFSKYS